MVRWIHVSACLQKNTLGSPSPDSQQWKVQQSVSALVRGTFLMCFWPKTLNVFIFTNSNYVGQWKHWKYFLFTFWHILFYCSLNFSGNWVFISVWTSNRGITVYSLWAIMIAHCLVCQATGGFSVRVILLLCLWIIRLLVRAWTNSWVKAFNFCWPTGNKWVLVSCRSCGNAEEGKVLACQ